MVYNYILKVMVSAINSRSRSLLAHSLNVITCWNKKNLAAPKAWISYELSFTLMCMIVRTVASRSMEKVGFQCHLCDLNKITLSSQSFQNHVIICGQNILVAYSTFVSDNKQTIDVFLSYWFFIALAGSWGVKEKTVHFNHTIGFIGPRMFTEVMIIWYWMIPISLKSYLLQNSCLNYCAISMNWCGYQCHNVFKQCHYQLLMEIMWIWIVSGHCVSSASLFEMRSLERLQLQ